MDEQRMPRNTAIAQTFGFGRALEHLKYGKKVARTGWNGKDMWIAIKRSTLESEMGYDYIYMSPVGGRLVPWLASQTDLLADDWVLIH